MTHLPKASTVFTLILATTVLRAQSMPIYDEKADAHQQIAEAI